MPDKFQWEIALIDPDGFADAPTRKRPSRRLFPHIGLGYLAACVEQNADRVRVLDAGVSDRTEVQRFLSRPAHLVGITTTSFTFREAMAVARAVKLRYPSQPVVLGGPHVAIDPGSCLAESAVDYALRGEAEDTLVDLIEVLKRDGTPDPKLLGQIPGLVYRNGQRIAVNPPGPRRQQLDTLPYPAWHLFPMDRYRQHALLTSRGCPMDCGFCAIRKIWGPQWVPRDPEQVVVEMQWLEREWGVKVFHFNDDNLATNPQHAARLAQSLISQRLKFNWVAQGVRADVLTPELLRQMRAAGCHRISLGIESAVPAVLEAVGKQETPEEIAAAIRACRETGIHVLGMFMVGNPGDTEATVKASIHFAREQGIDWPAFYMALPYPGTRLWEYARTQGHFLDPNYLAFDHMSPEPVFETPEFTAAQRRHVFHQAERFCRFQMLKYHLTFWWPTRLWKRNGFEVLQELRIVLKVLIFPYTIVAWLFQRKARRRER